MLQYIYNLCSDYIMLYVRLSDNAYRYKAPLFFPVNINPRTEE